MCFIIRTIVYNAPLTLREISRISKCSVSKTSRIVKHLENQGLVIIKVKGRNYLIYPNLESNLLKFELLKEEVAYSIHILRKYPHLSKALEEVKGRIIMIFGSYAVEEADDLSDIDILTIDGKIDNGFSLRFSEFRELLKNKNPTLLSIIKKHVIIKGFEDFVDEVLKWKRTNWFGV